MKIQRSYRKPNETNNLYDSLLTIVIEIISERILDDLTMHTRIGKKALFAKVRSRKTLGKCCTTISKRKNADPEGAKRLLKLKIVQV